MNSHCRAVRDGRAGALLDASGKKRCQALRKTANVLDIMNMGGTIIEIGAPSTDGKEQAKNEAPSVAVYKLWLSNFNHH